MWHKLCDFVISWHNGFTAHFILCCSHFIESLSTVFAGETAKERMEDFIIILITNKAGL